MLLRRHSGRESPPIYDPIVEASFISIRIYHGGIMKRTPDKHYVEGNIDYIDYVNREELNLDEFKKMAEICGYIKDSITFWHRYRSPGNRWRLVSTDNEAYIVGRNIQKDNVIEIYFEHLDSYFNIDNVDMVNQARVDDNDTEESEWKTSSGDDFSDSEVDFSDDLFVDMHKKVVQSIVDEREILNIETKRKMAALEGDSDCVDSADTKSLHSDSESESFYFPRFNPLTDADNPILALEYTFECKLDFKNAVETHEIKNGKCIRWCKNDKVRVKAVCIHRPKCKWEIMAYRMQRDTGFQIRKYDPTHSCKEWHYNNRTITSSFIARKYLKEIGSKRDWSLVEFRDRVSVDLRAHVTKSQAKRAKMKAIALIDGDIREQYKMIWDYCIEIDRTNPGSTIHMKFTDNEIPNKPYRFQRIYICFAACKLGFKAGCRKIVGVDGCWLKGPMYGTQLLTAVSLDGNNNIFPVAYAIVEKESRETWAWFLNYLAVDLDIDERGWTFMSDKQKGLIEAFNEVLPYVSHRFCVRHLHNNFNRAGFSGFTLKKALWAAAMATTLKEFKTCMERMEKLDPNAAAWLDKKEPSQWSRSHFSSDAKCDTLLNNLCEVFNSMICDAREKPILTLLEKLRYLLMARMLANREKAQNWSQGDVCPKIKDILLKNQTAAGEYIPRKSNQWNYEILGGSINDIWAVDLENRTCSCRKWSITGIPCKHAAAAIWAKKDDILDYVHECYKVETYRRIYEHAILPMNGPQMWDKSTKVPPLPPRLVRKNKRGRTQKARRKEADEVGASRIRMKRKQKSLDCSICNKPGHNKRTCKYNLVQDETTTSVRKKLPVRRGQEARQEEVVEIDSGWRYSQQTQES